MTPEGARESIQRLEVRAKTLRKITEAQEMEEYDSDKGGCESCFDPRTEEMMELEMVEHRLEAWQTSLAFLELYERQPQEVKEDDDIAAVWWLLRRNLAWATDAERTGYDATRLEKAATKAMYSPRAPVHEFMRQAVFIQNSAPLYCGEYLPREFMHTVVRLGLMDPPTSRKVDPFTPSVTNAAGQ